MREFPCVRVEAYLPTLRDEKWTGRRRYRYGKDRDWIWWDILLFPVYIVIGIISSSFSLLLVKGRDLREIWERERMVRGRWSRPCLDSRLESIMGNNGNENRSFNQICNAISTFPLLCVLSLLRSGLGQERRRRCAAIGNYSPAPSKTPSTVLGWTVEINYLSSNYSWFLPWWWW